MIGWLEHGGVCYVLMVLLLLLQVANLWLIIIGGSMINKLDSFASKPSSIVDLLGASVPAKAQVNTTEHPNKQLTTINNTYAQLNSYYY